MALSVILMSFPSPEMAFFSRLCFECQHINILSYFFSHLFVTEYNLTSQALNIDVLKFHSKKITVVISDCGFWLLGIKSSSKLRV